MLLFRLMIVIAALAALPFDRAQARARPDQVLVLYNKDWTGDLDGSAPGQDSEEVARYYVERRTDPKTGRKPYILGLSSPDPADPCLNRAVLPEKSHDNWLGLEFDGEGPLSCTPWPLSSAHGPHAVPFSKISEGRGPGKFAVAFISHADRGPAAPRAFQVSVKAPNGTETVLLDTVRKLPKHAALQILPLRTGILLLVDLQALEMRTAEIMVSLSPRNAPPVNLTGTRSLDKPAHSPDRFMSVGAGESSSLLPGKSALLEGTLSDAAVVPLVQAGVVYGFLIRGGEMKSLNENTFELRAGTSPDRSKARVLCTAGRSPDGLDLAFFRTTDGGVLVCYDFTDIYSGTVWVWLSARPKKNGDAPYDAEWVLHDLRDFSPSETGPDGVRDDQTYVSTIEDPVRSFLANTRTDDGTLLRDHILYFVIVHGLPLQVRSLYGIERGTEAVTKRKGNHGAGSALTQRIRMLHYDIKQVNWQAAVQVNGGQNPGGIGLAHISHTIKSCLVGRRYNPYQHPLTHNEANRKAVWNRGLWQGVKALDPPKFTSSLRASRPPEKFLYGAGRIDAPDIETCRNQVDGALYGEQYFNPRMGTVYYGAYREGPFTGEALAKRGFDCQPIVPRAGRALLYFGVFGYGATTMADIGLAEGKEVVWERGFYPGSVGAAIRSFLGWDRTLPPTEEVKLFDQIVRAGVTVTAGSAGGAHETAVSWWDHFMMQHLLFSGYEYGDAALRSMLYLDWTLSLVGDPLYTPELWRTRPDMTPPQVERKDSVRLNVVPGGPGHLALQAEVALANTDPEMVEIEVVCRAGNEELTGAQTRFSAAPRATVTGLKPDTEYAVSVTLKDPYANVWKSDSAIGPLAVRTGPARETRVLTDTDLGKREGEQPFVIDLPAADLDESGEVHLWFTADGKSRTCPALVAEDGSVLLDARQGFRVGGARMSLRPGAVDVLESGNEYHLVLRWRRAPVTREVSLVAADGTEFPVARANSLPWNPADRIGKRLTLHERCPVTRIKVLDDASPAPPERRTILGPAFDKAGFEQANARG